MKIRQKEIALTTLIDLFVQILFVFVMILATRHQKLGDDGGFDISKPWQKLVEALDLAPKAEHLSVAQAAYEKIEAQGTKIRELELEIDSLQAGKVKTFDGRAPGKPRCKNATVVLPALINVKLRADGTFFVSPYIGWREVNQRIQIDYTRAFGNSLTDLQFLDRFGPLFQLSENQDCRYSARIEFDKTIPAAMLDRNVHVVEKLFYRK